MAKINRELYASGESTGLEAAASAMTAAPVARRSAFTRIPVYSQRMRERHLSGTETSLQEESPRAMAAIGVFLFFGAIMALPAGTTLAWRGTFLDQIWVLNAPAYRQLALFGKTIGVPFLVLGAALAAAGGLGEHCSASSDREMTANWSVEFLIWPLIAASLIAVTAKRIGIRYTVALVAFSSTPAAYVDSPNIRFLDSRV